MFQLNQIMDTIQIYNTIEWPHLIDLRDNCNWYYQQKDFIVGCTS